MENINVEPIEFPQKMASVDPVTPTPNNPPWNGWTAVGVWILSVIAIFIFPGIFVLPYILSVAGQFENRKLLLQFIATDPIAIILQVAAIIPAHIFTFLVAWLVVTKMRTFSFRSTLGWKSGGMKWWHYAITVLVFFALAIIVINYYPPDETEITRILNSSRTVVFVFAFLAAFTAPLVEEVVYRGILFSAFQRRFGSVFAVLVVTLLFASVHIPQNIGSVASILLIALLSLIITLIRLQTNNLLPCIIFHTLINAPQSIFLILQLYYPHIATPPDPAFILSLI